MASLRLVSSLVDTECETGAWPAEDWWHEGLNGIPEGGILIDEGVRFSACPQRFEWRFQSTKAEPFV